MTCHLSITETVTRRRGRGSSKYFSLSARDMLTENADALSSICLPYLPLMGQRLGSRAARMACQHNL